MVFKECHHPSLFPVALFVSLHFSADSNLLRSFKKPPTANSHLTIDEAPDHLEVFRCSWPVFLQTALVPLCLNGQDGGCGSVKSGGTGVLCEARRGPISPVVNEEVMQRVASPFFHSSSLPFFLPSPFVPTLWLTSECKVLSLCVCMCGPYPLAAFYSVL